jgi:hypothetical protein
MKGLMEKAALGGMILVWIAGILIIAGIMTVVLGFAAGPFIGVGEGIVAVANSNADLEVWYNSGAHLEVPNGCAGETNDPVGNLIENFCRAGAEEGIKVWNETMSNRAMRLALLGLVPGVLIAFLGNWLSRLLPNGSNATYRGSQ